MFRWAATVLCSVLQRNNCFAAQLWLIVLVWNSVAHSKKQQHAISTKLHNSFILFISLCYTLRSSPLPETCNGSNDLNSFRSYLRRMSLQEYGMYTYLPLSLSVCRRHKPGRSGGADVLADPHHDPAPPGHEALPAVPHRDPPSSAQHEPFPQLQHGESRCGKQTRTHTAVFRLTRCNKGKTPEGAGRLVEACVFASAMLSHEVLIAALCNIDFIRF